MGTLTPSNKEVLLYRRMFEEKTRLLGIEGFLYEVKEYKHNFRISLDNIEFHEPKPIRFLFEDLPTIKTLKNLNWYNEDEDSLPVIAYLPWFIGDELVNPRLGSILEIIDPISKIGRKFQVMDVNANTYYMIHYIVKMAPIREEFEFNKIPRDEGEDIIESSESSKEEKDDFYEYLRTP